MLESSQTGITELKAYVHRFMPATYDAVRLEILYFAFRHKRAHLSIPYVVFDTRSKRQLAHHKQRRITWTVYARKRAPPIELVDYPAPISMTKTFRPWPVSYDSRAKISVSAFWADIIQSTKKYLHHLRADLGARERFAKCMKELFP
jgi:hypothetical protein